MSTMASQITSLTIVYSTVYSRRRSQKHQSSASLSFVRGIHWWLVNSLLKGPVSSLVLYVGNPLVTSGFPTQRAGNMEYTSMSWCPLGQCNYITGTIVVSLKEMKYAYLLESFNQPRINIALTAIKLHCMDGTCLSLQMTVLGWWLQNLCHQLNRWHFYFLHETGVTEFYENKVLKLFTSLYLLQYFDIFMQLVL